ncbi:hypothetical protein L1049_021313 [Liquidambar formosana]|uniref:FRIGIDA-like protein n=1 Tax=Liquidambar formosana TaxID=63359 RepID=A0AAP0X6U5_LIQFO
MSYWQVFFALAMACIGISQTSSLGPDSRKAKIAAASIFAILDRESKIDPSDESGITLENVKGDIELRHVSFKYPIRPDIEIFRDLCLTIRSGKSLGRPFSYFSSYMTANTVPTSELITYVKIALLEYVVSQSSDSPTFIDLAANTPTRVSPSTYELASMENVLAELKLAELKKDSLRKTLDTLQSQSSSLLRLTVQWKDLQDHFNSIKKLIQRHSEEFESKEKHFDLDRKSVDERSREVELKEEKLESVRKWVEEQPDSVRKWKEERAEVVEAGEKRLDSIRKSLEKRSEEVESKTSQLELERKMVLESVRELELKEKKFELLQRSLEERSQEVETKVKALDLVRKWIEDCSKEVELKGNELESKRKLVEELSDSVRKWMEGVELKEKQLDLRQKSIEEGSEELQSKKNQFESLEERCQEVKLKEKRVDSVQKSVEGRCRELEWKEEKFEAFQRLVEERSEEVESKAKWLDSIQNLIEERSKEIELKEKSLDSILKSIEERSKEVELKEERLGMNEKSIEERCQELRMQEKQIDAMQKSVENRFEKLDLKGKEFNSMEVSTIEKSIEEGCIEVELKEKQLNSIQNLIEECSKEFTSKERQPDSITEGVEELRLQEKPCSKSIQFSVKENFKELELKERELKLIRERMEKCQGDLELKEKQFDSVKKSIEDCLEELKSKEKQLESIQKLFEERSKDLELKEKQFESIQKSIEECDKELKQKEKVVASIQNSIEQGSNNTQSQVMSKPLEDLPVHNAVDCSSSGDLRVCITMNGKSLQLFLNKRLNEHESMRSGVSSALRMSSDAAKLVLDAMQGFYPPHSKEGDVEFEASVIRRSCILLLEQLMSVAPQINPNMKEEAVKLAGEWRAKMRVETHNSWEVLGFLQLLATYGVASAFDAHDLLHLLGTVAQHRKVPELRRVLALADKIPDVIELLIEKQQWLEAIRYSFAFELVDMFPPLPLLEAQLKCCKEVTKEIYLKGNPTHIAEVAEKESPVLRAVIKCIADYKLESVYSPVVLETRILQLEKHKADSRRTAPAPAQMALPQQQIGNKRPWTVVSAQDAPNANFGNASAIHLVQPPSWHPAGLMNPGAKYSRTSAGQRGPLSPHMSSLHGPHALTPTPSIIKLLHISFSSWLFGLDIGTNGGARQYGFAGTHPGGAANLGAPQYELASTSGRWRWFTTKAPSSFPS